MHLHNDLAEVVVLAPPRVSPHPALVQNAAQRVDVNLQAHAPLSQRHSALTLILRDF